MKILLGTTVLRQCERQQTMDGIAYYTQGLLKQLRQSGSQITEKDFAQDNSLLYLKAQLLLAGLTGKSMSMQQHQVDLFHATDHIIPKIKGLPVVATIMDPLPLIHPEWVRSGQRQLKNWLFKQSAQWADHIITISEFSAREIVRAFELPPEKISVVPLAVETPDPLSVPADRQSAILQQYALKPGFFLFIGTIQPRKNLHRMLDAHLSLPATIRQQHPLVIVGNKGWQSDDIILRLKNHDTDHHIIWLQRVNDEQKQALMQSATALVFPSLYEGFGLPVLEAYAADLPVITSNGSALPEVAGDAALMVEPTDTREIAAAMLAMISSKTLRDRCRARGRLKLQQYHWQKTAAETQQVYQRVITQ